jgi:hypothetical protein
MSNNLHLVKRCPLPRNWEHAFGYPGNARWIAIYWLCDDAVYEDGEMAGRGNFGPYRSLTGQYKQEITLVLQELRACTTSNALSAINLLGSVEDEAIYHLILDLAKRKMYVALADVSAEFLKRQQQRPQRTITPPSGAENLDWLEKVIKTLKEITPKRITAALCTCHHGWVTATDGGFDPCPRNCDQGIIWEEE